MLYNNSFFPAVSFIFHLIFFSVYSFTFLLLLFTPVIFPFELNPYIQFFFSLSLMIPNFCCQCSIFDPFLFSFSLNLTTSISLSVGNMCNQNLSFVWMVQSIIISERIIKTVTEKMFRQGKKLLIAYKEENITNSNSKTIVVVQLNSSCILFFIAWHWTECDSFSANLKSQWNFSSRVFYIFPVFSYCWNVKQKRLNKLKGNENKKKSNWDYNKQNENREKREIKGNSRWKT